MSVHSTRYIARIIALRRARRYGWLQGRTLQDIADAVDVNRSTILRNLREMDCIDQLAQDFTEKLKPKLHLK